MTEAGDVDIRLLQYSPILPSDSWSKCCSVEAIRVLTDVLIDGSGWS